MMGQSQQHRGWYPGSIGVAAALLVGVTATAFGQAPARGGQASGSELKGKKVAILVADGFEEVELTRPRAALDRAGARTYVISPQEGSVKGWNHKEWGDRIKVDVPLASARAEDYDALLLPGGVMNPDKLRTNPRAVQFVKEFVQAGKPVAAICHGPWTLVEAGAVRGRRLTSWPSLKTDVRNAGGTWVNQEVVVDRDLVTSRMPSDIPAFNAAMIALFAGQHQDRGR